MFIEGPGQNMNNVNSTNPQGAERAPKDMGFSPWERLKTKRISYLTLPLLLMATVVEFVILATGWKYQQVVCLPQGMGVTFFGIGPIGATILAVELLKLPLAIWTASRAGWQKGMMLIIGLPLICLLTFQLVKDMAVYEMGMAMLPANQMLEKAAAEETKISQLNGELAAIDQKRAEREKKLAELAAKQAKAKADLDESIKRNESARQDAISLTDYQKKELTDVEARQAAIVQQYAADTEQLTKAISDLRARRDAEFSRSAKDSVNWESRKGAYDAAYSQWHTEDARIDNAYQKAMADYTNKKTAYEKDKAEYVAANFLKRQLMHEPVDPGVPPVREVNKYAKPAELDNRPSALIADFDAQIKAKEAELLAVNNKKRERIAQVDADARQLREEFDRRSVTKREESDKKREELSAALVALTKNGEAEAKQIDQEFAAVVQKTDSIRSELAACRKTVEGYYEAREAAIRKTQVHRIATTVEIVRGLFKGERPMSIKATARERGDILTDQISMVRIWVYPVLAFIVAFLPTLMVEIGFSTVFQPDEQRPAYRIGLLGRGLHKLYTRAGRFKILRAERMAAEAAAQITARDRALAATKAEAEKVLFDKEAELQVARDYIAACEDRHEDEANRKDIDHADLWKKREQEWVAKLASMADSLTRANAEKDAVRDLQKSEVDRQIQLRQTAWTDRISQLTQELNELRATSEAERANMMQEHHKKLLEISESSKTQVLQARRQAADTELGAVEATTRLKNELKEAVRAREEAETQLKQQSETFNLKLDQANEEATREMEKAARQEKHRLERLQLEFEKALRQRDETVEQRLKQREQELSLAYDARLVEEKNKIEQEARAREAELERSFEERARELEARWKQEIQQREEAGHTQYKRREQQLQAQAETRLTEAQSQAEQEFRRREADLERMLETQARDGEARMKQELAQKELAFQARLKQREQEAALRAETRETELQAQFAANLRAREEEWERQTESRVRAAETRFNQEAQQKEELFLSKSRQREQQWQAKLDESRAELLAQHKEAIRRRENDADGAMAELENRLRKEMQQKDEEAQGKARQREQDLVAQLSAQAEARQMAAQAQWETESEKRMRAAIEPFKVLLANTERERDEARLVASDGARQVEHLEKKLTEASSFLNSWRNGSKALVETT
jgi:hypothetical protein